MMSSLVKSKQIISAHFQTFFLQFSCFLIFLNIQIYFIILKTYEQQFTLTTKKSLHIIFKFPLVLIGHGGVFSSWNDLQRSFQLLKTPPVMPVILKTPSVMPPFSRSCMTSWHLLSLPRYSKILVKNHKFSYSIYIWCFVRVEIMKCWYGYLSGVRCKWSAYGSDDATATPSSLASLKFRPV